MNAFINQNKKIKLLIAFGTRPEAIKLSPLIFELKKSTKFELITISVSQHIEMLDQVLQVFGIEPDINLKVMKKRQDLFELTARILYKFRSILKKIKPKCAIVQGDTTSAFAVTLSAFYEKVLVAHVEAGLRTYNIHSPYPEEINRQLISRIASIHFAPSKLAKKNLIREGIDKKRIFITGNTGIDALYYALNKINKQSMYIPGYNFSDRKIILVTAHRRENFGDPLKNICIAIKEIARRYPYVDIVFPVHLNPNVREIVFNELSTISNIYLIEPLDYLQLVYMLSKSYIVLTDSGGIQEEAPYLGKPLLILRDITERPEVLASGNGKLVGCDIDIIVSEVEKLLNDSSYYAMMGKISKIYGDGKASKKIVSILERILEDEN